MIFLFYFFNRLVRIQITTFETMCCLGTVRTLCPHFQTPSTDIQAVILFHTENESGTLKHIFFPPAEADVQMLSSL